MDQDLRGNKGVNCYSNFSGLLDFVRTLANPFIIEAHEIRLHNFVTEQVVRDEIMNMFDNREKVYMQRRDVCP